MCYLTIRTCKTKALPQSSKQINGTREQSQSLGRVTRTKLLKGQTARKTLYVLNKIWLLLETSRNIFLITLRNCKHHTGRQQPTERHLPRESA